MQTAFTCVVIHAFTRLLDTPQHSRLCCLHCTSSLTSSPVLLLNSMESMAASPRLLSLLPPHAARLRHVSLPTGSGSVRCHKCLQQRDGRIQHVTVGSRTRNGRIQHVTVGSNTCGKRARHPPPLAPPPPLSLTLSLLLSLLLSPQLPMPPPARSGRRGRGQCLSLVCCCFRALTGRCLACVWPERIQMLTQWPPSPADGSLS